MSSNSVKYFAIIPAAGVGKRFAAEKPKQYLTVADKALIEHSLLPFIQSNRIEKCAVAINADDQYWSQLAVAGNQKLIQIRGGAERFNSVLSGLNALDSIAADNDWILVHDAARPCFTEVDLNYLIDTIGDHPVGGLLALRVCDTIKRSNTDNEVVATVDRENLWQAQTPQMFRFGLLKSALEDVIAKGLAITDDASAVELMGFKPLLVPGSIRNIKVTRPKDLEFVANVLHRI